MRIGFDISMLVYQGSGVATYTYQLVRSLLALDKENEYHLFYSSLRRPKNFYCLEELKKLGGRIYAYRFPPRLLMLIWNKWHIMPVEWLIGKVDIYQSSDYLRPPLLPGTFGVTTIHDLTWRIYPQFHTGEIVNAHQRKLAKTIKYKDAILLDSSQTKKDLQKYYPGLKNKLFTVPLGVADIFFTKFSHSEVDKVLNKYNIDKPYILYVGAIEPRKNINILVSAFRTVLKRHPDLKLVLAGRAGWKNEEVYKAIRQKDLANKVIITGYVQGNDLPKIYQGAKLFVYPTTYEGFGLPPLESLAGATPTLAFNSPSLPGSMTSEINQHILSKRIIMALQIKPEYKVKIYRWKEIGKKVLLIYRSLAGNKC